MTSWGQQTAPAFPSRRAWLDWKVSGCAARCAIIRDEGIWIRRGGGGGILGVATWQYRDFFYLGLQFFKKKSRWASH
jgi:hypothetical protein